VKIETKMNCPLNKFEPCKLWECAWFIQLHGKNPMTGADLDEWGCSVAWLPMLLVEHSQMKDRLVLPLKVLEMKWLKPMKLRKDF